MEGACRCADGRESGTKRAFGSFFRSRSRRSDNSSVQETTPRQKLKCSEHSIIKSFPLSSFFRREYAKVCGTLWYIHLKQSKCTVRVIHIYWWFVWNILLWFAVVIHRWETRENNREIRSRKLKNITHIKNNIYNEILASLSFVGTWIIYFKNTAFYNF